MGFTMKCRCFFSPDLFEKDHSYPTNKNSKKFWGALSTIDFSKVPIVGGMLWNSPSHIGAKSKFLSNCLKPITFLLQRCGFYHHIDIYQQDYWLLFTFNSPGWSHRVKEYPSFGKNSQILAICTMMITWVSPLSAIAFLTGLVWKLFGLKLEFLESLHQKRTKIDIFWLFFLFPYWSERMEKNASHDPYSLSCIIFSHLSIYLWWMVNVAF